MIKTPQLLLSQYGRVLSGHVVLFQYRMSQFCTKADPVTLLPVEIKTYNGIKNLEETGQVVLEDDITFCIYPNEQRDIPGIIAGIKECHPEFEAEPVEDDMAGEPPYAEEMKKLQKKVEEDKKAEAGKKVEEEKKAAMDKKAEAEKAAGDAEKAAGDAEKAAGDAAGKAAAVMDAAKAAGVPLPDAPKIPEVPQVPGMDAVDPSALKAQADAVAGQAKAMEDAKKAEEAKKAGEKNENKPKKIRVSTPPVDKVRKELILNGIQVLYSECQVNFEKSVAEYNAQMGVLAVGQKPEDFKPFFEKIKDITQQYSGLRDDMLKAKKDEVEAANALYEEKKSEKQKQSEEMAKAIGADVTKGIKMPEVNINPMG